MDCGRGRIEEDTVRVTGWRPKAFPRLAQGESAGPLRCVTPDAEGSHRRGRAVGKNLRQPGRLRTGSPSPNAALEPCKVRVSIICIELRFSALAL
jgi:hypothetical protein